MHAKGQSDRVAFFVLAPYRRTEHVTGDRAGDMATVRPMWDWRLGLASAATIGIVIIASLGLVRYQNRHRSVTTAVQWAADAIAAIPDSLAQGAYPLDRYHAARDRFVAELRSGSLPVDSVRAFYQVYASWARDGILTADEVAALGPYLGLSLNDSGRADSLPPK